MALGLVLVALVTLRGLSEPLGNGDEIVYAQGIREMRATGDLATLHWQGEPVLERPTVPFLPVALASSLVPGELGLRLFSGLCSLAILLVVFRMARDLGLPRDGAMVAVVLTAGVPSFHLFSRALLSDPPFVLATTLALWAAVRAQRSDRALLWAGVALGAAVACKSLAAAVPAVALAPWLVRGARKHATTKQIVQASLAFLAVALPYYLVSLSIHGSAFLHQHFVRTLVDRAQGELSMGMPGGVAAYGLYLWQADGPVFTLLFAAGIAVALFFAVRERRPEIAAVATVPVVGFVLFSIVGTRLPHYLLPLYPAFAVATAWGLEQLRRRTGGSGLTRALPVALAVALLGVGITSTPREHFMPSPEAVEIGKAVALEQGGGGHLYTLDWYAPAAAYYGGRTWRMLTGSKRLFEMLDSVDHFHAAGVVRLVPPWPAQGTSILVAGERSLLQEIPGIRKEVAVAGDFAVIRVEVPPP